MNILMQPFTKYIFSMTLVAAFCSSVFGDTVLDTGIISAQETSGGGFLAGTTTFDLTDADVPNVQLIADLDIIDAGVEVRVNGTSLFPLFDDVSQFSPDIVFTDTGVTEGNGNIDFPFSANDNGLPRLTIDATSAETTFGGAAFRDSTDVIDYTPNFQVEDFSSLLITGANTIEFFVLNSFQGANLQGSYEVIRVESTAVPEPTTTGLALFTLMAGLSRRRRRAS